MAIKIGKPELRRWVKALRSDDYTQAQGSLCVNESDVMSDDEDSASFCCLGVACDLFLDAYWHENEVGAWEVRGEMEMPPEVLLNAINMALPNLTSKIAGHNRGACALLARRNDDGRSFKQIANAIEKAAGL